MNYKLIIEGHSGMPIKSELMKVCWNKKKADKLGIRSLEANRPHKRMQIRVDSDEMMDVFGESTITFEAENALTYQSIKALISFLQTLKKELTQ